ncbi:uncharacterized protein LOC111586692 isoform X3 [Amphiprion ocellaris]|uniref:uncharacterized protein LOC111586692 isoform X3 n=1 Tax=Amphiprion ocellaris TaxID=80972 RepID=UPI0024118FED|nr:uncharacterized protein LOC111586692 isoform X3 [Amphiprion ocellaris]
MAEKGAEGSAKASLTAAEKQLRGSRQELDYWKQNAARLRRRNRLTGLAIGAFVVGMFFRSERSSGTAALHPQVWTGLRYLADQWMWVRGEPVTYQMSSNCPGSRSCGALEKDGNAPFNTRKCHQRKNFLCSRRP